MCPYDDEPMYRTFAEFEREELRRADSVAAAVDEIFDGMFVEELTLNPPSARRPPRKDDADDEE
jgi:hypothetical protein